MASYNLMRFLLKEEKKKNSEGKSVDLFLVGGIKGKARWRSMSINQNGTTTNKVAVNNS